MIIELTDEQFQHAIKIGQLRQSEAERQNLPDKYGFDGRNGFAIHVEGAAGELAVALALEIPWDATVNTFKRIADLGQKIEIRTRSKATYDLIIRPDDADDRNFVLVLRLGPRKFEVAGWIPASQAKQESWLQTYGNRPPAYFIPRSALQPIETLLSS